MIFGEALRATKGNCMIDCEPHYGNIYWGGKKTTK